jgi:putative ABC transport system permease protein
MLLERLRHSLPLLWRSLARRSRVEQDLVDELADHVQAETDAGIARGLAPEEARRLALAGLGGVDAAMERCRDSHQLAFLDALAQDLRFGARMLRRSPGFTTVAVLTLALGIGANTAVFSLVDGILLSPLPFSDPDRLVSVQATYPVGAFAEMREAVHTLDVAAYADGHAFTLIGDGEPLRLTGALVSADLLPVLGVTPALGRWTRPGEDRLGAAPVAVLSHGLWKARFLGDPNIVGRFINLDGVAREVVGVMPATFQFPSSTTRIWVPFTIDPRDISHYADVRLFQSRIGAHFPWPMPTDWNREITVVPMDEAMVGGVRSRLLIFMAAVLLVLVIACANVANLSLSRAVAREREIGIRAAIGAGPGRIARQLITESVLLALVGALAGLVFAVEALTVLRLVLPADTPRLADASINWHVLAFTGLLAVAAGCAFGLAPVVQTLRLRLRSSLDAGGRAGRRAIAWPLRAGLTIAQVAGAVLLVIAAGLLVRSLWSLSHVDPGFDPDQVVTAVVSPTDAACAGPERCLAFYQTLESRVRTLPGVEGAAFVNTLPLTGAVAKRSLELEGVRDSTPLFWLHAVTPGYFGVMRIQLQSGRLFTTADRTSGERVALVSLSTARHYWPDGTAIGRRVRFADEASWHTIVGVVADVRAFDLTESVPPWIKGAIYVPYGPASTLEDGRIPTAMTLTVRTSMRARDVAESLRQVAATLGTQAAVSDVRPMSAVVAEAVAAPAATTSLLVTMAGLALVLGIVGVYGVLSFLVSRQTRDLGIRMALGAQRRDVFWLVIRDGAVLCLAGVGCGVAGALALSRLLSSELYGVSPTDPATYLAVAAVMSLVSLAACYVPTRRAMGVNPLIVLRDQ